MGYKEKQKLIRKYNKLSKETNKILSEQNPYKNEVYNQKLNEMNTIKTILESEYGVDVEPSFDLDRQIE